MILDHHETPRARIAWLSPSDEVPPQAAAVFAEAGYEIVDAAQAEAVDIAIIDFRQRRVTAKAAEKLAVLARSVAPECGVVYLGSPTFAAAERAHLRRSGELVLIEETLAPAIEACRHRLRLRNIAEETGERLKTIAASARLAEFPPIETASAGPAVLIAGEPGAAALAALDAASKASNDCVAVLTAGQALRAVETGRFDCAVFLPRSEGDPLVGLAKSMRRHRRFQDMPVMMCAAPGALRERLAGAYGADFMPTEHLKDDLGARLATITRRARLIAAMRRFLTACAGDGVRDKLSGAFTPQFFAQHTDRVFARSDQTGRRPSLIGLRLAPLAGTDTEAPASRTLTEAARMINRVTRAEDLVGRLTSDTFLIMLSATRGTDALAAARRIEGVIANTMFRSRCQRHLYAVAAATTAVERPEGQRLEETIASVLGRLNKATPRTAER